MKNQYITLLIFSLLSCTAHAKVTVQDALNDTKYYANQVQGVSEADALADWKHNGGLPYDDGTGELETIQVVGKQARSKWSMSYAKCPSGYKLTGGGYLLTVFEGGHAYNAPNGSYADVSGNQWVVSRGGMPEDRAFKAYAICVKNQ